MAGEKIVQIMQKAANAKAGNNTSTALMFGEVLSISPLEINVDSRYVITDEFIIKSGLCDPKYLNDDPLQTLVWRGLQVGDKVRMLRVNGGQLFYILDREGGLTI